MSSVAPVETPKLGAVGARRVRIASTVLMVVLIAGCAGSAPQSATLASSSSPSTSSGTTTGAGPAEGLTSVILDGRDCQMHAHNVPIDPEASAALLPPGFTGIAYQGVGVQDTLVFAFYHCGQMVAGATNATAVDQALIYMPVTVPGAYQSSTAQGYRAVLAHVSSSEFVRAAYMQVNITVADGQIAISLTPSPAAEAATDSVTGPFSLSTTSGVTSLTSNTEARLRFLYIKDKAVQAAVDFNLLAAVDVRAGGIVYQLSGSAPVPTGSGAGYTAHYDFSGVPAYTITKVQLP